LLLFVEEEGISTGNNSSHSTNHSDEIVYIPAAHGSAYIAGGPDFHKDYEHGKYFYQVLSEPAMSYVFRRLKPQEEVPIRKVDLHVNFRKRKTMFPWLLRHIKGSVIEKSIINQELRKWNQDFVLHSPDDNYYKVGDRFKNTTILNILHIHSVTQGIFNFIILIQ
jgi:hypothetical protein